MAVVDLEHRRAHLQARLVGGHVVAGEGVIGPAGEEQQRAFARPGAEVQGEGMILRIAADRQQAEVVGVPAVEAGDAVEDVVAMLVDHAAWGPRPAGRVEAEGRRGRAQPLVGEDLLVRGMSHRHQREAIHEQAFLELVGDPQLVATRARPELLVREPHVLVRVGVVPLSRPLPVAHLTAAHEVRHEREALAVPGV